MSSSTSASAAAAPSSSSAGAAHSLPPPSGLASSTASSAANHNHHHQQGPPPPVSPRHGHSSYYPSPAAAATTAAAAPSSESHHHRHPAREKPASGRVYDPTTDTTKERRVSDSWHNAPQASTAKVSRKPQAGPSPLLFLTRARHLLLSLNRLALPSPFTPQKKTSLYKPITRNASALEIKIFATCGMHHGRVPP